MNRHGEPIYTLEKVFPETHPGMVLRGYRTREDMTQKALAARIGISASNLSDMEHGRRPIGTKMAKRLGEALNLDYRLFL